MVTLKEIEMYSQKKGADAIFQVVSEEEDDGAGNMHPVVKLVRGDEIYRFSPNITDDELRIMSKSPGSVENLERKVEEANGTI